MTGQELTRLNDDFGGSVHLESPPIPPRRTTGIPAFPDPHDQPLGVRLRYTLLERLVDCR